MVQLSVADTAMLEGRDGAAAAMAMRIVLGTARMLGATDLTDIASAHIDGCLYHGDSGTGFAERLVAEGGRVRVPSTLNVGALDLLHAGRVRLPAHQAEMARRMMRAYVDLGCRQTWTCSPYQAGHRPAFGQDVAWGESNAVAFCNSVLGARTNRYGDFLDICAAITGRAPRTGLHLPENRLATILVDTRAIPSSLRESDVFYPVLGSWLGRTVGTAVAAIRGLPRVGEDRLKALGAAAASTGAVGLFHIIGSYARSARRAHGFRRRSRGRDDRSESCNDGGSAAALVHRYAAPRRAAGRRRDRQPSSLGSRATCFARRLGRAPLCHSVLCLHGPACLERDRRGWNTGGTRPTRRHPRGRYLHRRDTDLAARWRRPDDEFRQIRAVYIAQHGLRRGVRRDAGLCGGSRHRMLPRSCRGWLCRLTSSSAGFCQRRAGFYASTNP